MEDIWIAPQWWWVAFFSFANTVILGAIGLYVNRKATKWEGINEETRNVTQDNLRLAQAAAVNAERAVENTKVTQQLIRENTDITLQVAEQTNGRLQELADAAKRASEARARIHQRASESRDKDLSDDLDMIESDYRKEEKRIATEKHSK